MIEGFELSEHASHQIQERQILEEWIEETLSNSERTTYPG